MAVTNPYEVFISTAGSEAAPVNSQDFLTICTQKDLLFFTVLLFFSILFFSCFSNAAQVLYRGRRFHVKVKQLDNNSNLNARIPID